MYEYLRKKKFRKKYLPRKFRGLSSKSEIWRISTDKLESQKKFSHHPHLQNHKTAIWPNLNDKASTITQRPLQPATTVTPPTTLR